MTSTSQLYFAGMPNGSVSVEENDSLIGLTSAFNFVDTASLTWGITPNGALIDIEGTAIGSGGAPNDAPYITYGDPGTLSDAQDLSLLGDGILKSTVTGGFAALEIAAPASDYMFGYGLLLDPVTSNTTMTSNYRYIVSGTGTIELTLPLNENLTIGDSFEIRGIGADGWRVNQNADQIIVFGIAESTSGASGYIESTHYRDSVKIEYVALSGGTAIFMVTHAVGEINLQ